MRPLAAGAAALVAVAGLTACQSTQDKSAELAKKAKRAAVGAKLVIRRVNSNVRVGHTTVLKDANGAAVVVELHNRSRTEQVSVPIAIDVKSAKGKTLFRNDAPGLEPTLVSAPIIEPRKTFVWVNDQVVTAAKPSAVAAKVGVARAKAPARLPRIEITPGGLQKDPVSGVFAKGRVKNLSKIVQRKLVIFGVARRGHRVVAAGRAQIKKLNPGRHASYSIFFIGNPTGARIEVSAPPSVLR
jgi:hypothetical protein